ncbi:MAG: hypothetical protein EBY21_09680 [Alphaproteobacteria bacterium]|nr:hypothetical protein [Alphaproteobacteria bacterium]
MSKDDFYSQLFERTRTESHWVAATAQVPQQHEAGLRGKIASAIETNLTWAGQTDRQEAEYESEPTNLSSYADLCKAWLATHVTRWTSALRGQSRASELAPSMQHSYAQTPRSNKARSSFGIHLFNGLSPPMIILMGAVSLGTTGFYVLRDQMIMSLIQRQNELELTYENRLMNMRAEIEKSPAAKWSIKTRLKVACRRYWRDRHN